MKEYNLTHDEISKFTESLEAIYQIFIRIVSLPTDIKKLLELKKLVSDMQELYLHQKI